MLNKLITEQRNASSMKLDQMSVLEVITLMNQEDLKVIEAVKAQLPQIEKAIQIIVKQMKLGGRLIYLGAGTSGRLGRLDAVECIPTFGIEPGQVIGLIAGGDTALSEAIEGSEDSLDNAINDLKQIKLDRNDVVVGLAASGRTPYVIGGLNYAHLLGAKSIAIACNPNALISQHADHAIEVNCGPEVLTGSTRLKAGTAQKMILNMISTGTMVQLGKVYQNLMVDLLPTNEKLVARSLSMIKMATGVSEEAAIKAYQLAQQQPKVAIVMILKACSYEKAQLLLEHAGGVIAKI